MRITKLVHSCLLVEDGGQTALFDPGVFSKEQLQARLDRLDRIDYLIITHNHQDHLDEDLVAEIAKRWPDAKLAANEQVKHQLKGIDLAGTDGRCQEFEAPHELLPTGGDVPQNSGWHFGRLSHPGDSLSFNETREILALPYVAPWGSTTAAVNLAKKLKPKHVIPIHDWHLSNAAKEWYHGLLGRALAGSKIEVLSAEDGTEV